MAFYKDRTRGMSRAKLRAKLLPYQHYSVHHSASLSGYINGAMFQLHYYNICRDIHELVMCLSLSFRRGSRVPCRGSRVPCRGSRVTFSPQFFLN